MRFNRYRLKVVQVDSRMSRLANNLRLRLCASREVIAEIQRIWEAFALPTPARANPLPGPIPPPAPGGARGWAFPGFGPRPATRALSALRGRASTKNRRSDW